MLATDEFGTRSREKGSMPVEPFWRLLGCNPRICGFAAKMQTEKPYELKIKAGQIPSPEGIRLRRALLTPYYLQLFHLLLKPENDWLCRALLITEYIARFRALVKDV